MAREIKFLVLRIFKWKFWEGGGGGDSKVWADFFLMFKFVQINWYNTFILDFFFLFIILHSVLLAAVLCENMLCKQDALLQNLQNLKIIFLFILIFSNKLGKYRWEDPWN